MKRLIVTLSALACAATLSFAEEAKPGEQPGKGGGPGDHKRPDPEQVFKKLDSSADGSLSIEEFKAGPMGKKDPAKAEEIFKKSDADKDGKVTLEEFKKAHQHRHGKGGHHKPAPGAPAPQ